MSGERRGCLSRDEEVCLAVPEERGGWKGPCSWRQEVEGTRRGRELEQSTDDGLKECNCRYCNRK